MERVNDGRPIAILVHTFPRPSTTFIADEVRALEARGRRVRLFAVRRPPDGEITTETADLAARTVYLMPLAPGRLAAAHLAAMARRPSGYLRALGRALLRGRVGVRDRLRTVAHFGEAVALQPMLAEAGIEHLHAHALSGPASIAWLMAPLGGPAYSLTAHGTDIFVERVLLAEKIAGARFARVGTRYNRDYLVAQGADGSRIAVEPFGVDVNRFRPGATPAAGASAPLRLVSVGRLVWQKAQHLLLDACAAIRRDGVRFELTLVGDGEDRAALEARAATLGIGQEVRFAGARTAAEVAEILRGADLFVLSSVSEGFGIVLLEAMASGVAVVAPALHGLGEVVADGVEGRLFATGSSDDLARVLRELAAEPEMRRRMGEAGRLKVETSFRIETRVEAFERLLDRAAAAEPA